MWASDVLRWWDWPNDRSSVDAKYIRISRGGIQLGAYHVRTVLFSYSGDTHFEHNHEPATKYPFEGNEIKWFFSPKPHRYAAIGFEWIPTTTGRDYSPPYGDAVIKSFTLPLYFPTLLFALLPAHYFLRVRRRRRIASRLARGCCVFCGYDLRASVGRCPECGREGAGEAEGNCLRTNV